MAGELNLSNNVKSALFLGEVKEFYPIKKDSYTISYISKTDMLSINNFNYSIQREQDMQGIPNGISRASELTLLIKLPEDNYSSKLYSSINEGSATYFSCIFNPAFDYNNGNLSSFDSAITAYGNIVAIKEIFINAATDDSADGLDRVMLKISMVMHSLEYITSSDPISMTLF